MTNDLHQDHAQGHSGSDHRRLARRALLDPSFAYSSEAQSQCTGDAFRLCSSEIPNIPKITACMFKHALELSAGLPLRDGPRPRPEAGQGLPLTDFRISALDRGAG